MSGAVLVVGSGCEHVQLCEASRFVLLIADRGGVCGCKSPEVLCAVLQWIVFVLAEVLGALLAPLKRCSLEQDARKGTADQRSLLHAHVQGMLSTAEREGAPLDEENMYADLKYDHSPCDVGCL